ncbi:hypothetical protein AALK14_06330 [Butyricimonas hominis]|uniref:hypothetical protein n=1 Tax=Butyricimonas TaxID=574697 RepID=UPI003513993F
MPKIVKSVLLYTNNMHALLRGTDRKRQSLFILKDLNINLCGKQWFYIFYEGLEMSGTAMIVKCFFIGI